MADKRKNYRYVDRTAEKTDSDSPEKTQSDSLSSQVEKVNAIDSFKEAWKPMHGSSSISRVFIVPKRDSVLKKK